MKRTIFVELSFDDEMFKEAGESRNEPGSEHELVTEIDRAMNASHFGGTVSFQIWDEGSKGDGRLFEDFEMLKAAVANLGVDLECGGCAATFYTGMGAPHTCEKLSPCPSCGGGPQCCGRDHDKDGNCDKHPLGCPTCSGTGRLLNEEIGDQIQHEKDHEAVVLLSRLLPLEHPKPARETAADRALFLIWEDEHATAASAAAMDIITQMLREWTQFKQELGELRAARKAYASEFPPNADGDPDVGSIHENIRKLKERNEVLYRMSLGVRPQEDFYKGRLGVSYTVKEAFEAGARAFMSNDKYARPHQERALKEVYRAYLEGRLETAPNEMAVIRDGLGVDEDMLTGPTSYATASASWAPARLFWAPCARCGEALKPGDKVYRRGSQRCHFECLTEGDMLAVREPTEIQPAQGGHVTDETGDCVPWCQACGKPCSHGYNEKECALCAAEKEG